MNSIFIDREFPEKASINYRIGYYAIELETCEKLLKMGYKSSNKVDLAKRSEWLEKEIVRLEDEKAALQDRYNRSLKISGGNKFSFEVLRLAALIGMIS